jgi:hypothetical protein
MNRRAVSSAIAQKDSRHRDFYLGRIVNVGRLPKRNGYTHTEWGPPSVNRRAISAIRAFLTGTSDHFQNNWAVKMCLTDCCMTIDTGTSRRSGAKVASAVKTDQ